MDIDGGYCPAARRYRSYVNQTRVLRSETAIIQLDHYFYLSSLHHVIFVVSQIALPVVAHFIDSHAPPGKISTPKVVHELVIFL